MLTAILLQWVDAFPALNVLQYITMRIGLALMSALVFGLLLAPWTIRRLGHWQRDLTTIREDLPEAHQEKVGTPSMGGLLIVFSAFAGVFLWGDLSNLYLWACAVVMLGYGAIGLWDDLIKMKRKSKGLPGKLRLVLGGGLAAGFSLAVMAIHGGPESQMLSFPFVKEWLFNLGWFMVPFTMLVVVGTANSVNLTDGLDGLAIVPVMIAAGCFGIISYLVGHAVFAEYLLIVRVPGAGELAVLCGALIGAGCGFLWYNAPPAKVFMGDTGSLAMGGGLGAISVVSKHEIVLMIVGGVFVLEAFSVMLQVASFRLFGRRVFEMAPIHHHFEKKGWAEPTIVIRFWIIAAVFGLIGLATLKLR